MPLEIFHVIFVVHRGTGVDDVIYSLETKIQIVKRDDITLHRRHHVSIDKLPQTRKYNTTSIGRVAIFYDLDWTKS